MVRANRFAVVIGVDFDGTDYVDVVDDIRNTIKKSIIDNTYDAIVDYEFLDWAERNMSEERFAKVFSVAMANQLACKKLVDGICQKAVADGWFSETEIQEIRNKL